MKNLILICFVVILFGCPPGQYQPYQPKVGKVLSKECVARHYESGLRYTYGVGGWKHRWVSWVVPAKYYLTIVTDPIKDNRGAKIGGELEIKCSVSQTTYNKLNVGDIYNEMENP